jgi:hypothetical protein
MFEQYPKRTARRIAVSLSIGLGALSAPAAAAPGVSAVPTGSGTQVSEGGAIDYYTLALTERPQGEVTVTFVLDGQVLVFPRMVTFQPEDYDLNRAVTVTVSAVDDETPEGNGDSEITHNLSSSDPRDFGGDVVIGAAAITASVIDDDLAAVIVSETDGVMQVTEGQAAESYTLTLGARPVSDVTVTVQAATPDGERPGPAGSAQLSVNPGSVTFTPANWATAQTITVAAIDDDKVEYLPQTERLVHVVNSADTAYNALSTQDAPKIDVTVLDDDQPGVVPSTSSIRVIEGATGGYTLAVTTQPETSVSVTLVPADPDQVTVTPPRITFTPLNYTTPQIITVSAVNDPVGEGPHRTAISHFVSTTDPQYLGVTVPPVEVRLTDDDVPGVLVSESDGSSQVSESGGRDQYTLVLATRPTDEVAVDVRPGSQLTASPRRVIFTPENYDQAQAVTLAAVDDAVGQGPRLETVTHEVTSSDPGYHRIPVDAVVASIADDDEPEARVDGLASGGGGSLSWPMLAGLLGVAGFLTWLRPRWKRWG